MLEVIHCSLFWNSLADFALLPRMMQEFRRLDFGGAVLMGVAGGSAFEGDLRNSSCGVWACGSGLSLMSVMLFCFLWAPGDLGTPRLLFSPPSVCKFTVLTFSGCFGIPGGSFSGRIWELFGDLVLDGADVFGSE